MKTTEYLINIRRSSRKKGIRLSDNVIRAFVNPKYFNKTLLYEIPDEKLNENIEILTEDVNKAYQKRIKEERKSAKPRKKIKRPVMYADVLDVVEKRFCSLPPICKKNIYKIKVK